jgi:hypothetical protein
LEGDNQPVGAPSVDMFGKFNFVKREKMDYLLFIGYAIKN